MCSLSKQYVLLAETIEPTISAPKTPPMPPPSRAVRKAWPAETWCHGGVSSSLCGHLVLRSRTQLSHIDATCTSFIMGRPLTRTLSISPSTACREPGVLMATIEQRFTRKSGSTKRFMVASEMKYASSSHTMWARRPRIVRALSGRHRMVLVKVAPESSVCVTMISSPLVWKEKLPLVRAWMSPS